MAREITFWILCSCCAFVMLGCASKAPPPPPPPAPDAPASTSFYPRRGYVSCEITSSFKRPEGAKLKNLADQIETSLVNAGYEGKIRYYRFQEGGFVIGSPIEHFNEKSGERLALVTSLNESPQNAGVMDWLGRTLTGKEGRYRVFFILVTAKPYSLDQGPMSLEEKTNYTEGGSSGLDTELIDDEWEERVKVTLLVYEYEKRVGAPATIDQPSKERARWHFEQSGLKKACEELL